MNPMNLGIAFAPNYFSLEDLIATQIRVPCSTNRSMPYFGFLDPSLSSEHLPAKAELELPLWAALTLCQKGSCTVSTPRNYKEAYREVLKADATVVDLNKMGPHFYQTGLQLLSIPNLPGAEEISYLLPQVFQRRMHAMAESYSFSAPVESNIGVNDDDNDMGGSHARLKESHMDCLERQIHNSAKASAIDIKQWLEK